MNRAGPRSSYRPGCSDLIHVPAAQRLLTFRRLLFRRATSMEKRMSPTSKRQLIDNIRNYNATAAPHFLAQFDENALKQYLEHLEEARQKRLRFSGWVRKSPKLRLVS
jgi:DNA-binding GntR family transcriptional regulator